MRRFLPGLSTISGGEIRKVSERAETKEATGSPELLEKRRSTASATGRGMSEAAPAREAARAETGAERSRFSPQAWARTTESNIFDARAGKQGFP